MVDPETGDLATRYFDTGRQVEAGFRLERLVEPGSPDPADWEAGPWGEHPPALTSTLPSLLVVAAVKPDGD